MAKQDIIVVGASAGGVAALGDFVHTVTAEIQASIFIVLHTSPFAPGRMPQVLSKRAAIKAYIRVMGML